MDHGIAAGQRALHRVGIGNVAPGIAQFTVITVEPVHLVDAAHHSRLTGGRPPAAPGRYG